MVEVRVARREDLAAIMAIESEAFPSPWAEVLYDEELNREEGLFLAAEDGEGIAGYLLAWVILDEGHLLKLGVGRRRRRQGIGSALLAAAVRAMKGRGVAKVWLEVRAGNADGMAFYEAHGYRRLGIRRGYYQDTGEDAVVMVREL
jgi:[ribosomal protein S18]-alanine N-acetyltransferase